jgi:exosortase
LQARTFTDGTGEAAQTRARWRWSPLDLAVAALLMAAGAWATRDAWADMIHLALIDEEQSHALLVPLVAAWLFWARRERLRSYVPTHRWAGPACIALGGLLTFAGEARNVVSFWHVGAILVVAGGLLSVVGGGFLVRFAPVFAALLFLVPVPGRVRQAVAIPLQGATAQVTKGVLETFGSQVEAHGNMLRINDRDVMIAEACNGLRMAFAFLVVSYTFAFALPLRNGFRVAVILLSPVLAILFNVVRLVPTVWAFGTLPPDLAEAFHVAGGWLMLPLAFLALVGAMRLLRWAEIPVTPYVLSYGS